MRKWLSKLQYVLKINYSSAVKNNNHGYWVVIQKKCNSIKQKAEYKRICIL